MAKWNIALRLVRRYQMENRKSRLCPRKKKTVFSYKVIHVCITNRPVRCTRNECPRDCLNEMPHKMYGLGWDARCSAQSTQLAAVEPHSQTPQSVLGIRIQTPIFIHLERKVLLLPLTLSLLIPEKRGRVLGCVLSYHRINVKLPSSLRLLWLPLRFHASFAPPPQSLNENGENWECISRRAKSENA